MTTVVHKHAAQMLLSGRGGRLPTAAEQEAAEEIAKTGLAPDLALIAAAGLTTTEENKELLKLFDLG